MKPRLRSSAIALTILIAAAMPPSLPAQNMGWDELRTVVERAVHLRMPDAQVAARLRKINPSEAVPASTAERAAMWDAGPLTQRELRQMVERSAGRPNAALAEEVRANPRGMQPVNGGEAAVVVEMTRLYAQEYAESIPNFLCFRNTRFLKESSPLGRWKPATELKEKLSHVGDEDQHEIVAIDGEEVKGKVLFFHGGLTVSGEFGNVMRRVFQPETETVFTWMGDDPDGDKDRVVLGFVVQQEHSTMRINSGDEGEVVMGYVGEAYASRTTGQIFRVRLTMDALPEDYPIRGATWDIRYGPVKVEERELLLPVAASVEAHQQGRFVRNEATYTDYQKYVADSSIRFEGSAPEEE